MSGTSADGVDAVLVSFPPDGTCRVLAAVSEPYAEPLREEILAISAGAALLSVRDYARLDAEIGDAFARAAQRLIGVWGNSPALITAFASHGQTIFHAPGLNSLQLGDPNRIAAACGRPVVADLRRADMAAGGQGAPLVPPFHKAMFHRGEGTLCVANLGGIANLSCVSAETVIGFDTGPANGLLDEWVRSRFARPYDDAGRIARSGHLHEELLGRLLADPWFRRAPPKSTGRDYFNLRWVQTRYAELDRLPAQDVARTLLELSARSLADAVLQAAPEARKLLVCGGGAYNDFLLERLAQRLRPRAVASTAEYGLEPQWVEAAAFAWLARCRLESRPGNLPSVTGARRSRILGGLYPG